ncbi:Scramblase family protein OS=Xanthomonas translucens pv. graminis ART-Xtg29 GN=XTG29_00653 PE=4 SV=1: Scramblase [Gemmata massiliana]|uniref:Scramblase n=1 Tax=Gemmata massiliana TaxID=1210884 RepID=A0A6P2D3A5_9BACT|nr:phospholipid scramblase-related protein [Gemmata massiliana]VTR95781.1 Scramblase family protein OS=Xanthomonas translucens pv. graminis ART-Xtg29 GN=XTG29_00653 PE=4 SV=1: Scramblase [Gemmata massiliana]
MLTSSTLKEWPVLELNTLIVKQKAKLFSSRASFEILDESGKVVGGAEQSTTALAKILGMLMGPPATKIEFREKPDDSLVFTVRRRGLLLKKVEVLDSQGAVIGLYKAKKFSLAGGFHVYDGAGKHVAEIRGKLLKSEYTFFQPDGKTEMGKVSKKWAGAMKEMFTSADTYAVQITPQFAEQPTVKMLILGAAVAIDSLMSTHGGGGGGGESDDE